MESCICFGSKKTQKTKTCFWIGNVMPGLFPLVCLLGFGNHRLNWYICFQPLPSAAGSHTCTLFSQVCSSLALSSLPQGTRLCMSQLQHLVWYRAVAHQVWVMEQKHKLTKMPQDKAFWQIILASSAPLSDEKTKADRAETYPRLYNYWQSQDLSSHLLVLELCSFNYWRKPASAFLSLQSLS